MASNGEIPAETPVGCVLVPRLEGVLSAFQGSFRATLAFIRREQQKQKQQNPELKVELGENKNKNYSIAAKLEQLVHKYYRTLYINI